MKTLFLTCPRCDQTLQIVSENLTEDTVYTCTHCKRDFLIWMDFSEGKYRASIGSELDVIKYPTPNPYTSDPPRKKDQV